jgi:hypothetical protein
MPNSLLVMLSLYGEKSGKIRSAQQVKFDLHHLIDEID